MSYLTIRLDMCGIFMVEFILYLTFLRQRLLYRPCYELWKLWVLAIP